MNKKRLIILIAAACLILTVVVCFIVYRASTSTIESITGVSFDDIAYVKSGGALGQTLDYDKDEFIKEYRNKRYHKINKKYSDDKSHDYYVCFDKNDNILFTLVETRTNDEVFIKKGKFSIVRDSETSFYKTVN